MKYYFASHYDDHPQMRDYRAQLLAAQPGSEVTSNWIDVNRGEIPQAYTQQTLRDHTAQIWLLAGQPDMEDLYAADVLVSFGYEDGGGKGGRHVEFGLAMAWGKRLVLIGTREHLFHAAPQVEHYETFDDFLRRFPSGAAVKRWFNRKFPLYRLCLHPWCLRGMTYDYRCWKHQEDP